MAIGARARDVLLQFLLEAIMISIIGCVIGVVLGVGGSLLISKLTGFGVIVTPVSIVMSFCVAAAIGIFFGWYPARKASRLKPIDALRYQ